MHLFPLEILIQIIANLSLNDIKTCQYVCRYWKAILLDDSNWRFALLKSLKGNNLLTRLNASSFKSEYIARFAFLQTFKRCTSNNSFPLNSLGGGNLIPLLHNPPIIYLVNMDKGLIFRCNTETGKIDKRPTHLRHGNAEGIISCCKMFQHDAILSGYPDGQVSYLPITAKHHNVIRYFPHPHSSPVTAIAQWKRIYVTASLGEVRIWNMKDLDLLSFIQFPGQHIPTSIQFLKKQIILATDQGDVLKIKDVSSSQIESIQIPQSSSQFIAILVDDHVDYIVTILENAVLIDNITIQIPLNSMYTSAAWICGIDAMILCTGTSTGLINIYKIHNKAITLISTIKAHTTSVTSITLDTFKIVSKSTLNVRVWDLSTNLLLLTLKDRGRIPGSGTLQTTQTSIISTSPRFVKSWQFNSSSFISLPSVNVVRPSTTPRKSVKKSTKQLREEVRQGEWDREDEKAQSHLWTKNYKKYAVGWNGITEDEMLMYAIALSSDGGVPACSGEEDELEFALRLSLIEK